MSYILIAALIIVGWWFTSGVEYFCQDSDVSKQAGRIGFLKKQYEEVEKQITVERLDAMFTKADDLDDQTQTLMESIKVKSQNE
jgi:hypothetical protein